MLKIVGIVVVCACVTIGFTGSGGHMGSLWHPLELVTIFGGSAGGFIIANSKHTLKSTGSGLAAIFSGKGHFHKDSYMELLALFFEIFNKARKNGLISIEEDIENPGGSEIFMRAGHINTNEKLVAFICDYLRIISSGNLSAFELENLMDQEIETFKHEQLEPSHAVQKIADGLPAWGIVAAVLGIVITMGKLGGPPAELGHSVATALVGTFLGILAGYAFVSPFAGSMEHDALGKVKVYECCKTCMLAMVNGVPPQLAVEFGRKVLPDSERPTFAELDAALRAK